MTQHNIVHIEIPASDLIKAGEFYNQLFGWKVEQMPEANYATWNPGEGPGGGFNPLGPIAKPGEVLIYVNSDDIEADLKQAVALGGTVVTEKSEIPTVGWFGIFKDPTGNRIALFTGINPA